MTTVDILKRYNSYSDIGEYCHGTKAVERSNKETTKASRMPLAGKGFAEVAFVVRRTVYTWNGCCIYALRVVPERGRPAQFELVAHDRTQQSQGRSKNALRSLPLAG